MNQRGNNTMFNKKIISIISTLVLTSSIYANVQDGKDLFMDAKCLSCHESSSFKHREEKVNNFSKLTKKVRMCEYNTATGWFDEEIDDVAQYLNHTYYHYKVLKK